MVAVVSMGCSGEGSRKGCRASGPRQHSSAGRFQRLYGGDGVTGFTALQVAEFRELAEGASAAVVSPSTALAGAAAGSALPALFAWDGAKSVKGGVVSGVYVKYSCVLVL